MREDILKYGSHNSVKLVHASWSDLSDIDVY